MNSDLGPLLYEGKAKKIFATDQPERVLVEFKNDATAFNALKREEFDGKGCLNCQISAYLFEILQQEGVSTHYLGLAGDSLMMAQRVEIIPLEIVLRNVATGSLCKQTPIAEGSTLVPPLVDIYYKDDALSDPLLTEARLELLDLITPQQKDEIHLLVRKVNLLLQSFFQKIDLLLVDFKLEVGVNRSGHLLVADEISPDTCRIWDLLNTDPKARILDKDRFRQDLGGVVDAYGEILKRIESVSSKPRNCS